MKNLNLEEQLTFVATDTQPEIPTDDTASDKVALVSFRELVPEINNTGYLTHAIFCLSSEIHPPSRPVRDEHLHKGRGLDR